MRRDNVIDIMKGIGIILVIVGHCPLASRNIVHLIYTFHMPLFFIVSGYLYKQRDVATSLKYDFYRLLVPYFVFTILTALKFSVSSTIKGEYDTIPNYWLSVFWGCGGTTRETLFFSEINHVGILWFLPALYWCKNIFNIVYNIQHSHKHTIFTTCTIAVIATYLAHYIINFPFGIITGASALSFFAIGVMISKCGIPSWWCLLMAVCFILEICYGGLSMDTCTYSIYPLDVLGACGGCTILYCLSRTIDKFSSCRGTLIWLGRFSLIVLCMHHMAQVLDMNTRLGTTSSIVWLLVDFVIILSLSYACTRLRITKSIFQIR